MAENRRPGDPGFVPVTDEQMRLAYIANDLSDAKFNGWVNPEYKLARLEQVLRNIRDSSYGGDYIRRMAASALAPL